MNVNYDIERKIASIALDENMGMYFDITYEMIDMLYEEIHNEKDNEKIIYEEILNPIDFVKTEYHKPVYFTYNDGPKMELWYDEEDHKFYFYDTNRHEYKLDDHYNEESISRFRFWKKKN